MSVGFAGNKVVLGIEGATRLLGTGVMEGVGAAVQAAPHSGTPPLTACTPATCHKTWNKMCWQTFLVCDHVSAALRQLASACTAKRQAQGHTM